MKKTIFLALVLCFTSVHGEDLIPKSEKAETLFSNYKDGVVQVRIIDKTSRSKSSIGSGFFISKDGYLISNFHVVSEWVYKPERYQIKYLLANKQEGDLKLVDIDVVHDLAVLKAEIIPDVHFKLLDRNLTQGETLYSFGNPHDIGLSIVEGTYNGYLEKSLYKKLHFTGSVNPGMSGGPVVDREGKVVGVNVSGAGNQLSFLVPKEYVEALFNRKKTVKNPDFLISIRDQLLANQQEYMQNLSADSLQISSMDSYSLPTDLGEFMKCWGGTEKLEKVLYEQTYKSCRTGDDIYLSRDQRSGVVEYQHNLYKNKGLGDMHFFSLMQQNVAQPKVNSYANEEMVTAFDCKTGQVEHYGTKSKLVFCLREYKKFRGVYDAWLTAIILAESDQVLQTSLMLLGVSYENAVSFSKAYMEKVQWNK